MLSAADDAKALYPAVPVFSMVSRSCSILVSASALASARVLLVLLPLTNSLCNDATDNKPTATTTVATSTSTRPMPLLFFAKEVNFIDVSSIYGFQSFHEPAMMAPVPSINGGAWLPPQGLYTSVGVPAPVFGPFSEITLPITTGLPVIVRLPVT